MSRIQRGSGLTGDDGPDWWQVLKNIIEGREWNDDGGLRLKPEDFEIMRRDDLNTTVSGSLYNSSLAQKYGINNLKFYKVNALNSVEPVSNNRIAVIVRKYNDGQIAVLFYDYGSNSIVVPGNLNLNSNITASTRQYGEYVIRNGGPTSGNDPLYGDLSINRAMSIFTSSSSMDEPEPAPGPPTPPGENEKTFSASDLDITFRQMQGHSAVIYNGEVTVKQERKDGYWVINFYDTSGQKLGLQDNNSTRQIWRSLWSGADGGYKVPDSYLREGDNDALGWVDRSFKKQPEPGPDPPAPPELKKFSITLTTGETKIQAYDWDGESIPVNDFVIHFEQQTDGSYQIYATPLQSDKRLWINVDRVGDKPLNRLSNGNWEIPAGDLPENATVRDVSTFFINNFKNDPEPPGPPPPASGYNRITGNTDSSPWKFLKLKNEDGSAFTGDYFIDYKQQRFGSGNYSGSVQDVQFFTFDSQGNKKYIKANFGDVSWGMAGYSNSPIFDSNGEIIGEKYSFSLPNDSRGSFEDFLNQYYDTDRNLYPPEPPPTPPTPPPTPPTPPEPPAPITERAGDEERGRINTIDHPGLIFRDSSGQIIEDNLISLFVKGDTDGDGKTEIYFRISGTGEPATIEQAQNYHYLDFPQPDTAGPQRRRLQETGAQITLYDVETGEDRIDELFENGFGASPNISLKEMNLLDALKIKAFILYKKSEKSQFVIKDRDNILNGLHIVGIMKDNIGKKKQFIPIHNLTGGGEPAPGQAPLFPEFRGTATATGGERAHERFDLYSPPDLCGGGSSGRRLMQCGPDEPPPEYNTFKKEISKMELLNFERNRQEQDRRDIPNYRLTQFERMRETTNERELISMYGTFSSASYIPEDNRPESLFGLDYDKKHSSNNRAVYIGRANKHGIISLRGTKPGNVIDLMSDTLILTGYEESLSLRFEESLKNVKEIMDAHPKTDFTLSSHSLGGALNEYVINELKGTPYEKRIKAISFNPGKAPNTQSARAKDISQAITDASILKAFKDQDPRFLPIYSSIQRDLGITAENITNPDILTNEQEMAQLIENYPTLTRSFNDLMGRVSSLGTIEERTAEARAWIQQNEQLLGDINYTASFMNIIKTKILFDLTLKIFDFTANYTIDSFLERESRMDEKLNRAVKPYKVLWSEGPNVIFKYKQDPISLHHSFFEENEKQNVRTYKGDEKNILWEGLEGRMSQGLKEHSMDNFLIDDHKKLLDHSETWGEYFNNLLNDNVESASEILNGLRSKMDEKEKEFIRNNGWADFLGLF